MTAALEAGEWSAARNGRTLPPGKTRYPLYRRLGGPQSRSGRAENLIPPGIRSRNVQPSTSVAIPTELLCSYIYIVCVCVYIYICVCVCVCVKGKHIYIYIYMYIYMCVCVCVLKGKRYFVYIYMNIIFISK